MYQDSEIRGCRVLVLLSGGIDSTAAVAFYIEQQCHVSCLFVDYGQAAGPKELLAAQRVAAHYGTPFRRITCTGSDSKGAGLVLGRNTFLLAAALMEFDAKSGIIGTGVHAGTPYYDCSEGFARTVGAIFDGYTDGRIRVGAPFLKWSKPDIWAYWAWFNQG